MSRGEGAAGRLLVSDVQRNALRRADKMPGGYGQSTQDQVATVVTEFCLSSASHTCAIAHGTGQPPLPLQHRQSSVWDSI